MLSYNTNFKKEIMEKLEQLKKEMLDAKHMKHSKQTIQEN